MRDKDVFQSQIGGFSMSAAEREGGAAADVRMEGHPLLFIGLIDIFESYAKYEPLSPIQNESVRNIRRALEDTIASLEDPFWPATPAKELSDLVEGWKRRLKDVLIPRSPL
jgi:hypothetical protein